MDKYCLLLSSESTDYYYNQLKFLLFSLRKYGGNLKDSFVYVSINDAKLQESRVKFLQENFGPIHINNENPFKPKFISKHFSHFRKFNLFSKFDRLDEFDKFIYLDTDTLIAGDLSVELDKQKNKSFLANLTLNKEEVIQNYFDFFKIFFQDNIDCIKKGLNTWNDAKNNIDFVVKKIDSLYYPNFHGGVYVLDKYAMSKFEFVEDFYYRIIDIKKKHDVNVAWWCLDQIAVSVLVFDKIKDYGIIDNLDEGGSCKLYHYYASLYGRGHYENPQRINHEEYQKTDKLKHMSTVIKEFNEKYGTN